ncbi:MAG TPA: hypothetical protein DHW14_03340 [Clostridiales bacterium]|nr:hypothetical protein [Clostridiales bacterium]
MTGGGTAGGEGPAGPGATGLSYAKATALAYDPFMWVITLGRYRRLVAAELDRLGLAGDEKALDLCCGTGIVAAEVARRLGPRGEVVAVDLSPAMLEAARRKLARLVRSGGPGGGNVGAHGEDHGEARLPRAEFIASDASDLPLRDGRFDLVTLFLGLHEVEPDRRLPVLQEVRRVLRPGGAGLVLDIGGRGPAWKMRVARWAITALEGPDAWTVTEPGVPSLLRSAGLEVEGVRPVFSGAFEFVRFRRPG